MKKRLKDNLVTVVGCDQAAHDQDWLNEEEAKR
jgi:hypothetical protein